MDDPGEFIAEAWRGGAGELYRVIAKRMPDGSIGCRLESYRMASALSLAKEWHPIDHASAEGGHALTALLGHIAFKADKRRRLISDKQIVVPR